MARPRDEIKRQRVNLFLDPIIVKQAKFQAVAENMPLSKLIEKVLRKYLPKAIGAEMKEGKIALASGPTIERLRLEKTR